ncbi:MAG: hypothetical protein Q4B59_05835 [Lachnospiraceae bacterium]|nr:hypothetical protein [Lachnospiraceae bacterium]
MKRVKKALVSLLTMAAFAVLFQMTAFAYWNNTSVVMTGCSDTAIGIKWNQKVNTDTQTTSPTDYYVVESYDIKNDDGDLLARVPATQLSYTFNNLNPGVVDYVTVYANYTNYYKFSSSTTWYSSKSYTSVGSTRVNTLPKKLTKFEVASGPSVSTATPTGASGVQIELRNLVTGKVTYQTCYSYAPLSVPTNTAYAVRGRAYYQNYSNKTNYYSAWTGYKYFTKMTGTVQSKSNARGFTLKLKKGKGIYQYVVYVSTKNGKGYKKTATLKAKSGTFRITKIGKSALKKKKTYYIKVVPVLKVGNKKISSCLPGYTNIRVLG